MKNVINHVIQRENLKKVSAIRLEIDYELVTLYDAIEANNENDILEAKEKLTLLVQELNALSKLR